jgi:putative restriction endonuclease
MKVYVRITDMDWYRTLAAQPEVRESNLRKPGGEGDFKALLLGEPFHFRTKWDHNKIVGGGYFRGYARLPLSQAWDFFGIGKGISNLQELTALVSKSRDVRIAPGDDPNIGCILLNNDEFDDFNHVWVIVKLHFVDSGAIKSVG